MKVKAQTEKNFRRAKAVKPAKKRAARRWWSWRAASVCAITALLVFAGYRATALVMHAEALRVQRIVVDGNVRLSSGEVQALVEGLRGTSILGADLQAYRARLLESPWVADVALRRVLPSTIEVFVSERVPVGLSRISQRLYLIDRSGTIIDEFGPRYAQFDLPIIDGAVRPRTSADPVVDERRVALAVRVIDDLASDAELAGRLSQIDVSDARNAVVLLDGDPALLHLGDERFAERLRGYLDTVEALRRSVPEIDYADLRFGDRIVVSPAGSSALRTAPRPSGTN